MSVQLVVASVLVAFFTVAVCAAPPVPPDQLPAVTELPDPFKFNDGSRVKSKDDWERRRAEILEIVQAYEYGHLPPDPKNTRAFELVSGGVKRIENAGQHKQYRVVCGPEKQPVQFLLDVTVPKGKGPFPVILRGDWGWHATPDEITTEVVKRGYVMVDFNRVEIAPDNKSRDTGIYLSYPDGDYGAAAAWAWGFHRAVDALCTFDYVAKDKIVVTGHSRGGKAVILAGATDPRIAITAPNNSGCGGAGSFKHQAAKSEDIAAITKNFPFWFTPVFKDFAGKQEKLPLDQHFVKALVAPRAYLSTEALGDLWANPEGSRVTHSAAREVFKFLGADDKCAIAYREGGHAHNTADFTVLLDFADQVFFQKKPATERDWDANPFPSAPKSFGWAAP
ncbi:MAG: hypothetical protein ACAI43_22185 [Phycisphaerae bacterium]